MATKDPNSTNGAEEEEEDDYMNMIIAEPAKPKEKETYTQRRIRKERESEVRGRVKSKTEREEDERAAREAALSKSMFIDPAAQGNKGLKMMAKMGFKPGVALGREGGEGGLEPVRVSMKEDRGGIGLDAEKKRRFREEVEGQAKRVKAEEGDYRERVRREREEVRHESQFQAAMKVAEMLSEEKEDEEIAASNGERVDGEPNGKERKISTRPLKSINVLWRGLVRKREEKERDRRMRYDLQQSLSRLPCYQDSNEDTDDRLALGKEAIKHALVEDLEEEDPELDTFNELPPVKRLQKLVTHLRENHFYCFWCKYSYPDKELDGCPGLTEEDHD